MSGTSTYTKVGRATARVTRGPSVTVAVFEFIDSDGSVTEFVGEAKRHPRDREDRNIGEAYAVGRALRAAAESMLLRADEMVVENIGSPSARALLDLIRSFQDLLSAGEPE